MRRETKLIDRRDGFEAIAAFGENAHVACETRRVAGDGDEGRNCARRQFPRLRQRARARRIEHDGVEPFEFVAPERTMEEIARLAR